MESYHLSKALLTFVAFVILVLLSKQQSVIQLYFTPFDNEVKDIFDATSTLSSFRGSASYQPHSLPVPTNGVTNSHNEVDDNVEVSSGRSVPNNFGSAPGRTSNDWSVLLTHELDGSSMHRLIRAHEQLKDESGTSWCNITSNLLIVLERDENGNDDRWVLQSHSFDGERKTMGGDEYHVTWTQGHHNNENGTAAPSLPTAVATAFDRNDGTYDLRFVAPPRGPGELSSTPDDTLFPDTNGTLRVTLQYSCGQGAIPQNEKDDWRSSGCLNYVYEKEDVPAPPYVTRFIPPNGGRLSPSSELINLTKYDKVVAVGDSVMRGFIVKDPELKNVIEPETTKDNSYYYENIAAPLDSDNLAKFHEWIQRDLDKFSSVRNNTALIVGSAAWDILRPEVTQGRQFTNHQQSIKKLVNWIKTEYPAVDLYWLSPMAIHIHAVQEKNVKNGLMRYMSSSRSRYLYDVQKMIMEEMDVTFLDVYKATFLSAEQHWPVGDGIHYKKEFCRMMLDWFYL